MQLKHFQDSDQLTTFPLDLTKAAVRKFPEAASLARALEADRACLEPIRGYLERKQHLSPEQSERTINTYLKYLLLAVTTSLPVAPSEEADHAWHVHIIHTKLYGPFCQRHFGRFLHHVPSDAEVHPEESFIRKQNRLGRLFFSEHTIYGSKNAKCSNSHSCHPMCTHSCSVHIRDAELLISSSEMKAPSQAERCASCTANG